MTLDDFTKTAKKTFQPGLKGILSILPFSRLTKECIFIFALVISIVFCVVMQFFPDEVLKYIDIVVNLSLTIIPSVLGLSLAGFAIIISQVSQDTLNGTAYFVKAVRSFEKPDAAYYNETAIETEMRNIIKAVKNGEVVT